MVLCKQSIKKKLSSKSKLSAAAIRKYAVSVSRILSYCSDLHSKPANMALDIFFAKIVLTNFLLAFVHFSFYAKVIYWHDYSNNGYLTKK